MTTTRRISLIILIVVNSLNARLNAINIPLLHTFFQKKQDSVIKAPQTTIGVINLNKKIDGAETERIIKKIISFSEQEQIKALLIIIDSGGGSTGFSELIAREIELLNKSKPIVSLIANRCCSGAYLISAHTQHIVAPETSESGGIGVVFSIEKYKNMYRKTKDGINAEVVSETIAAGKYKASTWAETPFDDEMRAYHQSQTNEFYKLFIRAIAEKRKLPLENATEWAEGKTFTGKQALELGLIDQIGGYSDAVEKLKSLLRERGILTNEKITFVE